MTRKGSTINSEEAKMYFVKYFKTGLFVLFYSQDIFKTPTMKTVAQMSFLLNEMLSY